MKKNRTLFILGLLLAVLLLLYGMLSKNNEKKEESEEAEANIIEADTLTYISYRCGEDTMTFEASDEGWKYGENRNVAINEESVNSIVETFCNLTSVRTLENPDDLADYGLSNAQYVITATDEDEKGMVLYIGNQSGDNYYAKLGDDKNVYLIDGTLVGSLSFELSDFAALDSVPDISSDILQKVTVTLPDETSTIYKEDEDLDELAGGFGALDLTDVVSYYSDDDEKDSYGLSKEKRTIVTAVYTAEATGDSLDEDSDTSLAEDTTEEFAVYIGNMTKDKTTYYVTVKGSDIIYQVSKDVVANLLTPSDTTSEE